MRIDEFSSPTYIDGSFSLEERTRFSCFGFDIVTTSSAPIRVRIDEFSSPTYIDGDFSTTEQTRFLTMGFSTPIESKITIEWSERYEMESAISLEKSIESDITLVYRFNSYIVDKEE